MRVAFLGSQEIGRRCLDVIADAGHDIVTIGTFDPAAHESWDREVADFAAERGIPRLSDPHFRTTEAVAELRGHRPDIIFVIGWRWILAPELLTIAPKGVLGIHGSLLPRLRVHLLMEGLDCYWPEVSHTASNESLTQEKSKIF